MGEICYAYTLDVLLTRLYAQAAADKLTNYIHTMLVAYSVIDHLLLIIPSPVDRILEYDVVWSNASLFHPGESMLPPRRTTQRMGSPRRAG